MSAEPIDTELATFWGADLATLTARQRNIVVEVFKELKKREHQSRFCTYR